MEPARPAGALAWVVGIGGVLAVLALLAAVFDLGPFREPDFGDSELITRGDEICRSAHEAFVELQRKPLRTAEQAAALTAQLIDIAEDEAKELEALDGPDAFEAEVADYVAARREAIETMREGQRAASERDAAGYASAQEEIADTQRERHRLARQIGFAVCSRPFGATG